jgi:hypothetical protein
MRIAAIICNLVLFVFACFVLVTDGSPQGAKYIVFALWSQLTRILTPVVISRIGAGNGWLGLPKKSRALGEPTKADDLSSTITILRIVAVIGNVVSFGFVCWAIADQYPHPDEAGVIEFNLLRLLTPILSLVVLLRPKAGNAWLSLHLNRKA